MVITSPATKLIQHKIGSAALEVELVVCHHGSAPEEKYEAEEDERHVAQHLVAIVEVAANTLKEGSEHEASA